MFLYFSQFMATAAALSLVIGGVVSVDTAPGVQKKMMMMMPTMYPYQPVHNYYGGAVKYDELMGCMNVSLNRRQIQFPNEVTLHSIEGYRMNSQLFVSNTNAQATRCTTKIVNCDTGAVSYKRPQSCQETDATNVRVGCSSTNRMKEFLDVEKNVAIFYDRLNGRFIDQHNRILAECGIKNCITKTALYQLNGNSMGFGMNVVNEEKNNDDKFLYLSMHKIEIDIFRDSVRVNDLDLPAAEAALFTVHTNELCWFKFKGNHILSIFEFGFVDIHEEHKIFFNKCQQPIDYLNLPLFVSDLDPQSFDSILPISPLAFFCDAKKISKDSLSEYVAYSHTKSGFGVTYLPSDNGKIYMSVDKFEYADSHDTRPCIPSDGHLCIQNREYVVNELDEFQMVEKDQEYDVVNKWDHYQYIILVICFLIAFVTVSVIACKVNKRRRERRQQRQIISQYNPPARTYRTRITTSDWSTLLGENMPLQESIPMEEVSNWAPPPSPIPARVRTPPPNYNDVLQEMQSNHRFIIMATDGTIHEDNSGNTSGGGHNNVEQTEL